MMRVETPVAGFTGEVAGVHFVDGVAEVEGEAALAYFERHGYTITEQTEAVDAEQTEAVDAAPRPRTRKSSQ